MFAVSVQDLKVSQGLAERLHLDLPILSDTDATLAKAFGIYDLPGSMGPFSTHSFWLIDQKGVIAFREVSLEMHVPFDHVQQAVDALVPA